MPAEILQRFGFTREEAEMYETLLPLGDVPIREVVRTTGKHPQIVYRLVDRLAAKGLLTSTTRHHRRYVRVEDPSAFYHEQQLKVRELKEALPDLLDKQKDQNPLSCGHREGTMRCGNSGREHSRSLRRKGPTTSLEPQASASTP